MDKTSVIIVSLLSLLCAVRWTHSVEIEERSHSQSMKDTRKLFGGYRITPRYCQPTRELSQELKGPNICMFNHECIQRNGIVVGACMDGFLFGACCQLPAGSAGELLIQNTPQPAVHASSYYTKSPGVGHITSSGVSKITQTLLYGNQPVNGGILPTAADNTVVQINEQDQFVTAGVTHPTAPDTVVVTAGNNEINGDQFKNPDVAEDRKTTHGIELTTHPYIPDVSPYIHISISNAPSYYTPSPVVGKPAFRPKPKPTEEYVLVPTINHKIRNKTDSIETIVNIVNMMNDTRKQSTRPPNIYLYNTNTATTRRPVPTTTSGTTSGTTITKAAHTTHTTTAPRRTTSKLKLTTKKRLGTTTKKTTTTKKGSTTSGTTTTSKKPVQQQYVSSTTFRPAGYTSKKPPSTSYVYSSTISKRPGSGTLTTVPGYAVTRPPNAPTIIVLGSTLANTSPEPLSIPYIPTKYTTTRPNTYTASTSTKHPVTVTINNHITQHIHNTSERPSPTVLITPKPSVTTTPAINSYIGEDTETTNGENYNNFPPVRNPNLNMSIPVFNQDTSDITTPDFIEDAALDTKVESFVNKIIAGLQEPFDGLKDIVYTGVNKTATITTTKKPTKKTTTRKPTTRVPLTTTTTVKTTTKKVRTTKPTDKKKVTTLQTTESYIEHDDISQDYRAQCGIRPLVKTGRIVGGKGATFGEFPWQVLVRESTWLGLFTKNKCGGVLISNKYVMTAAHCQPGFLASLVAVFGEFDISGDLEAKRAISRNVKRVIVHRQYDAATFENDLALLELEHPIQFDAHIVPICLPRDHEDFTGRMATVTGWGRLKYGGGVPSVLQEVQVPIMENVVCQEMFRTAGHQKVILESFLCAGYANGQKDSCEGDSGGPLVLQRPDGRYQLAGTVSHGIKCAAPYLPGVYMRTTYYKPWIVSITGVH